MVYLKIDCNRSHRAAEKILEGLDYNKAPEHNLRLLERAKIAAGDLAYQYDFEEVKLYLLNNQPEKAWRVLPKIVGPSFPGHHSYQGLGLIAPEEHLHSYQYAGGHILNLKTRCYVEAQLVAAVYSANKKYVAAYDTLNDAAYWARRERINASPRRQQELILKEFVNEASLEKTLSFRGRAILEAEAVAKEATQKAALRYQSALQLSMGR